MKYNIFHIEIIFFFILSEFEKSIIVKTHINRLIELVNNDNNKVMLIAIKVIKIYKGIYNLFNDIYIKKIEVSHRN